MSMHNYANYADVVEESFVKEVVGEELDVLINFLDESDISMEYFTNATKFEDLLELGLEQEKTKQLEKLWKILQRKFKERTGLSLELGFHEAEGRGDEINGYFWCVDGVYEHTSAGKKYKDKIERRNWVTFG